MARGDTDCAIFLSYKCLSHCEGLFYLRFCFLLLFCSWFFSIGELLFLLSWPSFVWDFNLFYRCLLFSGCWHGDTSLQFVFLVFQFEPVFVLGVMVFYLLRL